MVYSQVTKERTKVVVVTLESTHKKLLKILENGIVKIGEHMIRAFLLYPSGRTDHFHHPPLNTGSANNLEEPLEDDTTTPLQTGWKQGNTDHRARFSTSNYLESTDSVENYALPPDNNHPEEPEINSTQSLTPHQFESLTTETRPSALCPSSESTVYSAIERLLIASKTGMHPALQYGSDTNKINGSTTKLDDWSPTSDPEIVTDTRRREVRFKRTEEDHRPSLQRDVRKFSDENTSVSEVAPNDTLTALNSSDKPKRLNGGFPPPKPKRTSISKISNIENSVAPKYSNIIENESESCNESDEVFVINCDGSQIEGSSNGHPASCLNRSCDISARLKRTVSVQYEKPPHDFSELMVDEEDPYFCSLDGLVKLMIERPSSEDTQSRLEKVRQANLNRSTYGVTHVEPGVNEEEEKALSSYLSIKKKRSQDEEKRKQIEQNMKRGRSPLPPADTFNFGDIVMGKTKEDILTDKKYVPSHWFADKH